MLTRAGAVVDVIDVQATGSLVVGGRMNVAQPGQGGSENQHQTQDHGSSASHGENYTDRTRPGQVAGIRLKWTGAQER